MKLIEGKNILVTGGSRGIGKSIVQVLIENGANVGFTFSSSESAAKEISTKLNSSSNKCIAYKSDASKLNECEKLVDSFLNDFDTIDVLINNAGITKDNLLMRMSEDDFDKVIDVNLKSVFNMTKACQRVFLKNRKGSIINMSSVVGVKGNAGQSNYAASKSGIIGFSKSIAQEIGSRNNFVLNVFHSDPPIQRIDRLKFTFRFHDGRLVDFKNLPFSFTLEFNMLKDEQTRGKHVRVPPLYNL